MVLMVNNSERVITIVDVLLTPGQPVDVKDEYLNHPGVQKTMKDFTERRLPVLAIVSETSQE
jgi:hypothetical protein